MAHVAHRSAGRREVFGALVADIGLRRLYGHEVRGGFDASGVDAHKPAGHLALARFGEQRADHLLGFLVVAFPEMVMADATFRVDEVMGRPVLIAEGAPD